MHTQSMANATFLKEDAAGVIKHSIAPSLPPYGEPSLSSPSNTPHRCCSLPWGATRLNYFIAAVAGTKAAGGGLHGTANTRAPG